MRTLLDIPEDLLEAAQKIVKAKTKAQAIIIALTEMIQRRKSRSVLSLKGTLKGNYDYKESRKKR